MALLATYDSSTVETPETDESISVSVTNKIVFVRLTRNIVHTSATYCIPNTTLMIGGE